MHRTNVIESEPPGHIISCAEILRLSSDSLSRALTAGKRMQLRLHLMRCDWCTRYAQQVKALRVVVQKHPESFEATPGAKLPAEARARIRRSLRAASL